MYQPTDIQYCHFHPERAAIEHCEVCGKGLCSYCLYYTDNGQRLCETHAREAHARGLGFNPPGTYAEGLISAQATADEQNRELKASLAGLRPFGGIKGAISGTRVLYQANNADLMAFVGMMSGLATVLSCCGGGVCIPVFGFLISLGALLSLDEAVDRKRSRTQAILGIVVSGGVGLIFIGVFAFWFWAVVQTFNSTQNQPYNWGTPISTSLPLATRTPSSIITLTPIATLNETLPAPSVVLPPTQTPQSRLFLHLPADEAVESDRFNVMVEFR